MNLERRRFLKQTAAASALSAIGVLPNASLAADNQWVKSVCRYCGTGCGLYVGVRDGKVFAVKGDQENHNAGFLCLKGLLLPQILDAPDRLLYPQIRHNGKFARASWDEALDLIASKFQESMKANGPESIGFYGSGQALTEETYAANKLFKGGIGTNNFEGNPRLCMASAVGGYLTSFGKDEPMGCYEDIDHADVFFLVGSNTAEAHPILFQRIVRRKEAAPDTKVIVLDPRRTPTARIADLHVSFTPGTDLAIFNAVAYVLVQENLIDREFIETHVGFGQGGQADQSFDKYVQFLQQYTPEKAAQIAGCKKEDIVQIAKWFGAKGKAAMSMWTMGLNQRTKGVWANNLVHNLHLITGKIGTPGSTPLSLTGQPNACGGVRDGGGLAHILPYGRLIANEAHRNAIESIWNIPKGSINPKPGHHTVDLFRALEEGQLKCLYIMTTNPGQSLPNVNRYREAMRGENSFVVVAETYHPTRTTELADVLLPAALWCEKEGVYGCTERRYQLLEKAIDPPGEARPDFDILCDLGRRMGFEGLLHFQSPADAWDEILKCCKDTPYDFTGMSRERLKEAHGLMWPLPEIGHPGTNRRYVKGDDPLVAANHPHRIDFYGRPDHKAVAWMRPYEPPAEPVDREYPYYLTTGRVIEHWHTATMTGNVKELKQAKQAVAEIHPHDADQLGIEANDAVEIISRRGKETFSAKITNTTRPGLIFVHMHDPDRLCNAITIDAVDPGSKEPEFKICAVQMRKI